MSYSDIEKRLHVPRSTLSSWLKKIKLTDEQRQELENRRREVAIANSNKRKEKTLEAIEEIKTVSALDIRSISKKELWLMGIILYWRERLLAENNSDIKKGINFTSSDPYLIKLFLKWLKEIGNIADSEIRFDIFLKEGQNEEEAKAYWYDVTEFPRAALKSIYKQKIKKVKKGKAGEERKRSQTQFGLLRIKVKGSSMIVRQIAGWKKGIIRLYWGDLK